MASAIIPIVSTFISVLGPQIPKIVTFVEGLFGNSATTGVKTGTTDKLPAAVSLLTTAVSALVAAGKLPAGTPTDPSLVPALVAAVQQVVDAMNAEGKLSPPAVPVKATTPTSSTATKYSLVGTISPLQ